MPAPARSAARDARPNRTGRTSTTSYAAPVLTLMLLWEEYRQREPDGYGYSRWCELYRGWEGRLSPTMRQSHPAGERMFVDYAGRLSNCTTGAPARSGQPRSSSR
jgi:transposase